jgi:hypothetical protein
MYAKETVLLGSLAAALPYAELQELFQTEDWNTLNTIWQTLNGVKPTNSYSSFPMGTEKGDSIAATIQALFRNMEFQSPEISRALNMTTGLCVQRTLRLSRMNPNMLTRMIPPWTETVQDGMLFSFEDRISTLSELVKEGEISAMEYAAARDSLLEKAITLSLLEMLNDTGRARLYDFPFQDEAAVTADIVLQRLDMSYRAAIDTLNKAAPSEYEEHYRVILEQHERFLDNYREFQETAPVFKAVLTELMEARR